MDFLEAIERLHARGVTDGLPVIPPTPELVRRFVEASGRPGGELVGIVPPNMGRGTVEKIAVNAVLAGARPEYMPVIVTAVRAICAEPFGLHGVAATTNFVSPLLIINGPVRKDLDVNCGAGVFGSGWRANATIGRTIRLVMVNLGGARPGVISMSTLGHPGRYTYCIGEHEEVSPWPPLHVDRGFAADDSTVAAFAGEAPHGVYDHRSRRAHQILNSIAVSLAATWNYKLTGYGDTLVVLSPEHARTIADDGWDKARIRQHLWERCQLAVRELCPNDEWGEGLPEDIRRKFADPEHEETRIPKFRSPENLIVIVAGGTAGRFSAVIPGFTFPGGSQLVIERIERARLA
ncbi:MAG: hypothetical protein HY002_02700 [Candidatus Rokubacteria bacterium]|nr:hypothetical protein [Candidatus Rokubacteria bacterium]